MSMIGAGTREQKLQLAAAGAGAGSTPLVTVLGVVEGDILNFLETHGTLTLRRLIRMVEWPTMMVVMGVGALIREGLVRAVRRELEVVIEPASTHQTT